MSCISSCEGSNPVRNQFFLAAMWHTDCISGSCCVHVCVSLGQTEKSATGSGDTILNALLAVDGKSGRYPEFKYNVAAVYTRPAVQRR